MRELRTPTWFASDAVYCMLLFAIPFDLVSGLNKHTVFLISRSFWMRGGVYRAPPSREVPQKKNVAAPIYRFAPLLSGYLTKGSPSLRTACNKPIPFIKDRGRTRGGEGRGGEGRAAATTNK